MSIKVKAKERLIKVGGADVKGTYRYVMQTEIYNSLSTKKVISEAALRSGIPEGALTSAWNAIGSVINAWATEGHSVAVPGLGRMRFGVRATSVADVNDVSKKLITSRRVIFVPSTEIRNELKETSINITCYDRDGKIVKRVDSTDDAEVEDPENPDTPSGGDTPAGGNTQEPENPSGGDNTGGGDNGDDDGVIS